MSNCNICINNMGNKKCAYKHAEFPTAGEFCSDFHEKKKVIYAWGADEITCPYCGWEDADSWESAESLIKSEDDIECAECGKTFKCSAEPQVYYYSRKMEDCEKPEEPTNA